MRISFLSALFLLLAPLPAIAQTPVCTAPREILAPRPDLPGSEPVRKLPIGGYTLAITWTPQYCRGAAPGYADNRFQCRVLRRTGFALHGLWPDGEGKDWPQYCKPVPILSQRVLKQNICTTRSAQLLQHEWAKHGSCMESDPAAYFDRSRGLYEAIRWPDLERMSRTPLTAGVIAQAFAAANRDIPPSAVRVTTTKDGWLQEIWFCMSKSFRYQSCPAHQGGGVSPATAVKVWRARR